MALLGKEAKGLWWRLLFRRHASLPKPIPTSPACPRASGSFRPAATVGGKTVEPGDADQLWDLVEYNAHYFNPHRMVPILTRLVGEPRAKIRKDPRLPAYLKHAAASAQLFENLKELPAKELATAIAAARELNHLDAEDFSDVVVATIAAQLRRLSAQRVSYFITAFAKRQIHDARFWRAAATAVAETEEPFSPQVLVSLFDAFRKSGLRSKRLYTVLVHRVYRVLDDLLPSHIPPIVATVGRVPLLKEDRERVTRALLTRWLTMLNQDRGLGTRAVTVQQILSLAVTLGLAPEEINTATFVRDVSAYVGDRFQIFQNDEIIVFLWAMQRLVHVSNQADFFQRGLQHVLKVWPELQANAALSAQRLIQLSDVLVQAYQDGPSRSRLKPLEAALLSELSESVQFCTPEGLSELLEIWGGNEAFWRLYPDFTLAIVKRTEEVMLESSDLAQVLPVVRALLGLPGLKAALAEHHRRALSNAVRSRGASDVERIASVVAGSAWEVLCEEEVTPASPADEAPATAEAEDKDEASSPAVKQRERAAPEGGDADGDFAPLLASWRRSNTELEVSTFLRSSCRQARGVEDALRALEAAAPFVQRLGARASSEVLQSLEELADRLTAEMYRLPPSSIFTALRACAVAGLPHGPLFAAATRNVDDSTALALPLLEALEAAAALRLKIPELQLWFNSLLDAGFDRRLSSSGLARLVAAAARLALLDDAIVRRLLQRLLVVASPVRPLRLETVATLCQGLYLAAQPPAGVELWQLGSWLALAVGEPTAAQASALGRFSVALLADPARREEVAALPQESQRAFARAALGHGSGRSLQKAVASDTTLKFRHEVAEALRRGGVRYDLDLSLGPGLAAELQLLRPGGPIWLLDGPEAFHRPFLWPDGSLVRVPAEQRRAEMLCSLRDPETVAAMEGDLLRWAGEQDSSASHLASFLSSAGHPVARLHWLEWGQMLPDARVQALLAPAKSRLLCAE